MDQHHPTKDSSHIFVSKPRIGWRRREYLQLFGGVLLAEVLKPTLAWAKKIALKLDQVAKLKTVGGWMIIKLKGQELLLIRDASNHACSVGARCPHQQSHLTYDASKRQIVCPKHGSRFTLQGKLINGPAQKNLHPIYATEVDLKNKRLLIFIG